MAADLPEFEYTELLPLGDDDTEYRLVTTEASCTRPQGCGPCSDWASSSMRTVLKAVVRAPIADQLMRSCR